MIGIIKLNGPFSRQPHCHITCRYRCNRKIYQGQVLFCVAEPFQWTSRHKSSTLFDVSGTESWLVSLETPTFSVLNGCCGKKIFFWAIRWRWVLEYQKTASPIWLLWSWSLMVIATSVNVMFSGCLWNTWGGIFPKLAQPFIWSSG